MTPAKILLFGEYTVLVGSQALAIPFPIYSCQLEKQLSVGHPNPQLSAFLEFLMDRADEFSFLDLDRLASDWRKGLTMVSSIPLQYGLGSSGAVTAEVYKHYARSLDKPLSQIRAELATMEKFMHGNSSGIDPLVCFCQKPLLFTRDGNITLIEQPLPLAFNVFLIDSKVKASTKEYVSRFLADYHNNSQFYQQVQQLITLVNDGIGSFLNASPQFIEQIKMLTRLQFEIFPFLFPSSIFPMLNEGLEQELFYSKLCGSGGGGFILGFTRQKQRVQQYFDKKHIAIFWVNK